MSRQFRLPQPPTAEGFEEHLYDVKPWRKTSTTVSQDIREDKGYNWRLFNCFSDAIKVYNKSIHPESFGELQEIYSKHGYRRLDPKGFEVTYPADNDAVVWAIPGGPPLYAMRVRNAGHRGWQIPDNVFNWRDHWNREVDFRGPPDWNWTGGWSKIGERWLYHQAGNLQKIAQVKGTVFAEMKLVAIFRYDPAHFRAKKMLEADKREHESQKQAEKDKKKSEREKITHYFKPTPKQEPEEEVRMANMFQKLALNMEEGEAEAIDSIVSQGKTLEKVVEESEPESETEGSGSKAPQRPTTTTSQHTHTTHDHTHEHGGGHSHSHSHSSEHGHDHERTGSGSQDHKRAARSVK